MKKFGFWLLVWLPVMSSLLAFPFLPSTIPTHWNFSGEITGWGNRQALLLLSFISPVICVSMRLLPMIDPKKDSYPKFSKSYRAVQLICALFFSVVQSAFIYSAFFPSGQAVSVVTLSALGILFCGIGNFMPKFKHNYFCGIKTPWTLASKEVWDKTHRMAGPLWFWGGLLMTGGTFLLAPVHRYFLFFAVLLSISLLPCGYSWWIWQKSKP